MPFDLKQKAGPLSRGAWLGVGGATFLLYYLYKRHLANAAAAAGTASSALLGGTTIPSPSGGGVSTSGSGTTAGGFSDFGSWEQAAINAMTGPGYGSAAALNDLTSWINGQCVTAAGYNAISGIVSNQSIGLPPGFGSSLPPVTVCPASTPSPTVTTPSPAAAEGVTPGSTGLPQLNWTSFPQQLKFGQYGPNDYTQIGVSGAGGSGPEGGAIQGAPVYAGIFGGLQQGFNKATLPAGTPLYAPTSLVQQGYYPGATKAA